MHVVPRKYFFKIFVEVLKKCFTDNGNDTWVMTKWLYEECHRNHMSEKDSVFVYSL